MDTTNALATPTLRDFIFGNETLESIKPTTKALGDTALVLIRPVYIGKLCQTFDSEEEMFHVEYASNIDYTWAEIWLSREWKESNAKRTKQQQRSAEERLTRETRNKRVSEIRAKLIKAGLDRKPGFVEHISTQILDCWKEGKYNELLNLLDLTPALQNYEQEDKETRQRIKQVEELYSGAQPEGTGHVENPSQGTIPPENDTEDPSDIS